MSPKSRKYKKVEAFFSNVRPAAPDSSLEAVAEDLTARVEEKGAPPSAEDTRPESFVPPGGLSPAGGGEKAAALEETPPPLPENALCVPLMVSGKTIGRIHSDGSETDWTDQEIEIVGAVAAILSRQLEDLHLQ
ncbi:MAG: hypothetical protein JW748_11105 [Anaerolineales bacterium]|nr:hypothetical protein [Anaerolineales bacterium]